MSADDPANPQSPGMKLSPAGSEDVELILEDEVEDEIQLLEGPQREPALRPKIEVKVEEVDGEDVEIIADDDLMVIEEEQTMFTEEFYRLEKEKKEAADKFFDRKSPTSVARLSKEIRAHASKYAAAMFEWFCCLPSAELLIIIPPFADIDTPFPVTPSTKRMLIRRELGPRMADVWRQTKSTVKLANHFKLLENVALLTLLDHAFANTSYVMDVLPLLKHNYIDKVDYYVTASFVIEHSDPRKWKEPEELITTTLLPPLGACIALYMLSSECVRGAPMEIPWETVDRDIKSLKPEELAAFEEVVRESMEQLQMNDPIKRVNKTSEDWQRTVHNNIAVMRMEEEKIRDQMKLDMAVLEELEQKYKHVQEVRKAEVAAILPADFEEKGRELAKAEDEFIAVVDEVKRSVFRKMYVEKADLRMEKGDKCWARRKLDSIEKFEAATFVELDNEVADHALVCFAAEPDVEHSVPFESIALGKPLSQGMAAVSEGVRIVARARHPLAPSTTSLYSGTIISKYCAASDDYAVVFDDFFDDYAKMDDMHLLMAQSFDAKTGKFSRTQAYMLVTPSAAEPEPATERRLFMLAYLAKYPEWNVVKMHERIGRNVFCFKRNGKAWVAQVLAEDRLMLWLRFGGDEEQSFNSDQGCVDFPCKKHRHHDEKIYRGNPRLKQVRTACSFDKVLAIYNTHGTKISESELATAILNEMERAGKQSRQEQRRMHRMHRSNGISFEPAVPIGNHNKGPKAQTARKTGAGLMVEPMVPNENRVQKKEIEMRVLHHEPEPISFAYDNREGMVQGEDPYHTPCTHDCLKGQDGDMFEKRFLANDISPYYVPILCGWRRHRQVLSLVRVNETGMIYYRAPCGRPFFRMCEIGDYLKETHSQLTVDLFTFSWDIDETAYVDFNQRFIKRLDMTGGAESRPISMINEVDDEDRIPASLETFIYRARRYPHSDKVPLTTMNKEFCTGCDCTDDCSDWTKCACQRLTHRESVRARKSFGKITKGYTDKLLYEKVQSGIYECNENCGCSRRRCINRVVQNDMKVPMQMMKTYGMGWGVRALVDIPHGTYISCYHGAILSDDIGETNDEGDEYYADLDFYNLAENEKLFSGTDINDDYGVFCDDPGVRDLTEREVNQVEKDDALGKFRKEVDDEKRRRKKHEQWLEEEQQRAEEEARDAAQEHGEELMEAGDGEGERKEEPQQRKEAGTDAVKVEGGARESVEDEAGDEEGEEEEEEEEEEGGDEGIDDGEDEGVEEGDSGSQDEEEEEDTEDTEEEEVVKTPSPPTEEKRKEERETRAKLLEKKRQMKEEIEKRFLLPMYNDENVPQLDIYFESADCPNLFLLDAKFAGNIGRQFNHGCEPNMFTQHIFVDTHDIRLPWVAFFAKRDIKAGEELLWDYGWNPNVDNPRGLKCGCGAETCRVDLL